MKKILVLLQLPPPDHGAAHSNKIFVSSQQFKEEFDATVISMNFNTGFDELHRFTANKVLISAKILLKTIANLLFKRPEIFYMTIALDPPALIRDAIYVGFARILGVKRVIHVRGSALHRRAKKSGFIDKLYRFILTDAHTFVLAPSIYDQDLKYYVPRERCVPIANGRPDPYANTEVPVKQKTKATVQLLFLSNMFTEKGPLKLLEVLGILKERDIPFEAHFVGPIIEDGLLEKMEKLIQQYHLQDCVKRQGGVYGEQKRAVFEAADIFLFPSLREAFGVVLIEAAAYQLPAVAFDEGGVPDVIQHGVTGFICPKDDLSIMADRIQELIEHPDKRAQMGQAGRKRFLSEFTEEKYVANLSRALQEAWSVK